MELSPHRKQSGDRNTLVWESEYLQWILVTIVIEVRKGKGTIRDELFKNESRVEIGGECNEVYTGGGTSSNPVNIVLNREETGF